MSPKARFCNELIKMKFRFYCYINNSRRHMFSFQVPFCLYKMTMFSKSINGHTLVKSINNRRHMALLSVERQIFASLVNIEVLPIQCLANT